jgi:hypothetical protein
MNLSNISRTNMTKGVSVLALFALVGVGYTNLRPDVEPESMRLKTDAELEGLADPLFEELFQDKYHRSLAAYKESKGLFSCDDVCQVHKRRLNHDEVELTEVVAERDMSRKAVLIRGRTMRLALMQERQAEASILRASRNMSSDQRISVRKAVRKAERDAERADSIAAYRASLGIGAPLTLAQKQERAAAKAAARIAAREAMTAPAQRMAEAQATQDAQWFEYLDEVATAHGVADWYGVEQSMDATFEEKVALKEGNHNESLLVSRGNVRAAARGAASRVGTVD